MDEVSVNITGVAASNSSLYNYGGDQANGTIVVVEEPTTFLSVLNAIANFLVLYGMMSTVILTMFGMGATLTLLQV